MKKYFPGITLLILAMTISTGARSQAWDNEIHGSDFTGDGRTTKLEIPLVVELRQDINFNGVKRLLIRNEPNLGDGVHCQMGARFNDITSSIIVHPGPDYAEWKSRHGGEEPTVTLYSDARYNGDRRRIRAGMYADLTRMSFNDVISSVRFDDPSDHSLNTIGPEGAAPAIGSIPLVMRLHTAGKAFVTGGSCDENDNAMWLTGTANSIDEYGGFNDNVSWVEVLMGPNWKKDWVCFFENIQSENHGGRMIYYNAPVDADLVTAEFNDILSSAVVDYVAPPTPPTIAFDASPSDGGGPNARIISGGLATLHWNVTNCPVCKITVQGVDYDTHATIFYFPSITATAVNLLVKPPLNTYTEVNFSLRACGSTNGCSTATCFVSIAPATQPVRGSCQLYYFKFFNPTIFTNTCFTEGFCGKDIYDATTQANNFQKVEGYSGYVVTYINDLSQVTQACQ